MGDGTQKVLTAQLRDMEEKGPLSRKVYAEVPLRVEYALTETGYSLKTVLDAMPIWDKEHRGKYKGSCPIRRNLYAADPRRIGENNGGA